MRALILGVIIGCLAMPPANVWARQKPVTSDVEMQAFKQLAATIPLGSRVKAQTTAGKRLSGVLMATTDEGIVVKKNTRLPEPAVTIRFDELAQLERDTPRNGNGIAKMAGAGIAVGAGAILTLILFFAALGD